MNLHKASHSNKKFCRYKCLEKDCGEAFFLEEQLTNHERVKHNILTEKMIKCLFCKMSFKNEGCLKGHIRNDHCLVNPTKKKMEYYCHLCSLRFSKQGLLKHNEVVHENQNLQASEFLCSVCHTKFRFASHLTEHMKIAHDENCNVKPELVCTFHLCKKKFENRSALANHLKTKHSDYEFENQASQNQAPENKQASVNKPKKSSSLRSTTNSEKSSIRRNISTRSSIAKNVNKTTKNDADKCLRKSAINSNKKKKRISSEKKKDLKFKKGTMSQKKKTKTLKNVCPICVPKKGFYDK